MILAEKTARQWEVFQEIFSDILISYLELQGYEEDDAIDIIGAFIMDDMSLENVAYNTREFEVYVRQELESKEVQVLITEPLFGDEIKTKDFTGMCVVVANSIDENTIPQDYTSIYGNDYDFEDDEDEHQGSLESIDIKTFNAKGYGKMTKQELEEVLAHWEMSDVSTKHKEEIFEMIHRMQTKDVEYDFGVYVETAEDITRTAESIDSEISLEELLKIYEELGYSEEEIQKLKIKPGDRVFLSFGFYFPEESLTEEDDVEIEIKEIE